MEIILTLLIIVIIDVAAMRWGTNSREKITSPEWKRRQLWGSFL